MSDERRVTRHRYQPKTSSEQAGYPDPADNTMTCVYCIDAREMGVGLPGCLRHFHRGVPQ